jgi:hypothetical protein
MGACGARVENPEPSAADLGQVLVGYVDGVAGTYNVAGNCQTNPASGSTGQALSNSILIGCPGTCEKEETGGDATTFMVSVDAAGTVITPFSMKCGTNCFFYGEPLGAWDCNFQ